MNSMYDSLDQFIINNLLSNKFQQNLFDSKNSNDSKINFSQENDKKTYKTTKNC